MVADRRGGRTTGVARPVGLCRCGGAGGAPAVRRRRTGGEIASPAGAEMLPRMNAQLGAPNPERGGHFGRLSILIVARIAIWRDASWHSEIGVCDDGCQFEIRVEGWVERYASAAALAGTRFPARWRHRSAISPTNELAPRHALAVDRRHPIVDADRHATRLGGRLLENRPAALAAAGNFAPPFRRPSTVAASTARQGDFPGANAWAVRQTGEISIGYRATLATLQPCCNTRR